MPTALSVSAMFLALWEVIAPSVARPTPPLTVRNFNMAAYSRSEYFILIGRSSSSPHPFIGEAVLDAFAMAVAAERLSTNGPPFLTVATEITSPCSIQVERDGLKNIVNLAKSTRITADLAELIEQKTFATRTRHKCSFDARSMA